MATIKDRDVDLGAKIAIHYVTLGRDDVPISQSDLKVDAFKPGFAFEIVSVQHMVGAVTATATYNLKIGTTSALSGAVTPVAGTRGDATLNTTKANLRGTSTDEINLHATTNGSGVLADVQVRVGFRPRSMRGEPQS